MGCLDASCVKRRYHVYLGACTPERNRALLAARAIGCETCLVKVSFCCESQLLLRWWLQLAHVVQPLAVLTDHWRLSLIAAFAVYARVWLNTCLLFITCFALIWQPRWHLRQTSWNIASCLRLLLIGWRPLPQRSSLDVWSGPPTWSMNRSLPPPTMTQNTN